MQPKIYHIVHVDRLASILASNGLLCDARIIAQGAAGTTIGMNSIKQRRLTELTLSSYPDLYVGQCVPFYFCPRSIMLYVIHRADSDELAYKGGQGPIVHLQADLHSCVKWAQKNQRRWAFTLSNAGSYYFEDKNNLSDLNKSFLSYKEYTDKAMGDLENLRNSLSDISTKTANLNNKVSSLKDTKVMENGANYQDIQDKSNSFLNEVFDRISNATKGETK